MLLDDIYTYLTSFGVLLPIAPSTSPWVMYESYIPDDQDQMIALYDTGGMPFDTLSRVNERRTFQTRVRGSRLDYNTAFNKWKQIFDLLQDAQQTTGSPILLSGYFFIQCMHSGPMAFNDDLGRPNLISNWKVYKVRS